MWQIRLQLDLGGESPVVEFPQQTQRKLVELMAQAIVAVHQKPAENGPLQSETRNAQSVEVDDDQ